MAEPRLSEIWRHPIKGHGFEAVAGTRLEAGRTMPWDRVWAIAHDRAKRVTPESRDWAACVNFSRGARTPALMAISAETDEANEAVTLRHPDRPGIRVRPDDAADAARLIDWLRPLNDPERVLPAFVVRADRGMTDSDFPSISILNHASRRALEQRAGKPLQMQRFRGNLWVEGWAPWEEFDLVGRDIHVGAATLRVRERIGRCKATTVDPATGRSDVDTLAALEAGWGHTDFGVYAEVIEGGAVAVGDRATT